MADDNAFQIPAGDDFGQPADYAGPTGPDVSATPKVLGILNIVYYLICGCGCGLAGVGMVTAGPGAIKAMIENTQDADARFAIEQNTLPLNVFSVPQVRTYTLVATVPQILISIALIGTGIGLLRYSEGARKWAVILSALLLMWMLTMAAWYLIGVADTAIAALNDAQEAFVERAEAEGREIPPFQPATKASTILGQAINLTLAGIYPIVCVILLSSDKAKRACR